MGAVASGGVLVLDEELIQTLGIERPVIEEVVERELVELERREAAYRGERAPPAPAGKTVVLVDDGLATGSTMRAAVRAVRARDPARIVVAVPVAAAETCRELEREADEVVCAATPRSFRAVGLWYDDFRPTSDDEVRKLLAQ